MALNSVSPVAIVGRMWQMFSGINDPAWVERLSGAVMQTVLDQVTYVGIGTVPGLRVWEGARKSVQLTALPFTIPNKKYEGTLRIQGDDIRRAQDAGMAGQVDRSITGLRDRLAQLWGKLTSNLIINGATNLGYDGVAYFSASHTENMQAVQTNLVSWVAATGTTPTAQEFADSIAAAIAQLLLLKDDSGEPINMDTNRFIVMIPPALLPQASMALKAQVLVTTAGAVQSNVITVLGDYTFELMVNPRLTVANVYYLFAADGRAFIRQSRLQLAISSKIDGSDFNHDYDAHEHGVLTIRGVGYGNWQSAIQVTFT